MPVMLTRCLLTLALMLAAPLLDASELTEQRTQVLQAKVNLLVTHLQLKRQTRSMTPGEYDQRYDATAQVLDAWSRAARTTQDAQRMEDWLNGAIAASQLGASRPMPAPPTFSQPELPYAEQLPPTPPFAQQPPPQSSGEGGPTAAVANQLVRRPTPPAEDLPLPSQAATAPAPTQSPRASRPIETEPPAVAAAAPQATANLAPQAPAADATPARPPSVAQRPWENHPAAAAIDWSDPFVDDSPRVARATPRRAMQSRFKPISSSPAVGRDAVRVDLLELSSRVAGHNSKLSDLEGALLGVRDISAFRLAALLRDLEQIDQEREFLDLYLQGLAPEEASMGPTLHTTHGVLAMFQRATERRRHELTDQPGRRAEAERAILAALDRKLADLSRN